MTTTRRTILSRFAIGAAGLVAGASLKALPAAAANNRNTKEHRRDRQHNRRARRRA